MTRIEYALWGVRGDNGLVSELRAIRVALEERDDAEHRRFAEEAERKAAAQRALVIALIAAVCSLVGTVVSLLIVAAL